MEMRLELVPVPVAEIDRAKTFYVEQLGFHADFDTRASDTVRMVQLTPPGSACSILLSKGLEGISEMLPGSVKGLILVVPNIGQTRDLLITRGVALGEIIEYPRGIKFSHFSDPDGNTWSLQEIPPNL